MERLTLEDLARLVDEEPTPEEQAILNRDGSARRQLEALRDQTAALKDLPAVLPPPDGWEQLRDRLVAAGLIRGRQRRFSSFSRKWMQAAAAMALFAGGTGLGAALGPRLGDGGTEAAGATASRAGATANRADATANRADASANRADASAASLDISRAASDLSFATVEEARSAVESAEGEWVAAYDAYQRLLRDRGLLPAAPDPASRAQFMELIRTASQTALHESPGDPFLNTVYVSATREQENLLRLASQDFWH